MERTEIVSNLQNYLINSPSRISIFKIPSILDDSQFPMTPEENKKLMENV